MVNGANKTLEIMETSKDQHIQQQEQELANQETGLSLELSGLIKLNKSDIREKVRQAVQMVEDGDILPDDALCYVTKGKELYTELVEKIKPLAEEKSYGKGYSKHGCDFTEKMLGVKYDYSNCGLPEYEEILSKLEPLLKRKKEIEEELQKMTKSREEVNTETGETYTVNPPVKKGKLGLALTIK